MKTHSENRLLQHLAATALVLVGISQALAADPLLLNHIRLVVPSSPGARTDVSSRQVALRMSETLGQPVIVDNKSSEVKGSPSRTFTCNRSRA